MYFGLLTDEMLELSTETGYRRIPQVAMMSIPLLGITQNIETIMFPTLRSNQPLLISCIAVFEDLDATTYALTIPFKQPLYLNGDNAVCIIIDPGKLQVSIRQEE